MATETSVDRLFSVLADPTRRSLVDGLRDGERTVGDLAGDVDVQRPGVSKHLQRLLEAGIVQVRRDKRRHYYSLRTEPFHDLERWANSYRRVAEQSFERLDAELERMKEMEE